MKKFLIAIVTVITMLVACPVHATQLPPEIKDYIIKNVPNATIRFDGLITLPDGTFYLPLIPAYKTSDKEFGVKYTYPENKTFAKRPEIVVFENNYCLLKLIKTKDKGLTVTSMKDLPIEVRSGLLPQDLLVPKGLVLPDTLVGILGDLSIPLNSNLKMTPAQKIPSKTTAQAELPKVPKKVNVIPQLKNKQFFITNFNSNLIYIMPTELSDVQYTLKLDSIPKAVKAVEGKYLLVATNGKTYIDVVDIMNEEIAKQVDIGVEPDEIVLTSDEKTAYVISNNNSNLYVIDIATMNLTKQIQIKGLPEKLNLSEDETKLVYQDSATGDVYTVELNNNYANIYQCNVANASKLLVVNNQVYVLSRTKHTLKVFPYQEFVLEKNSNDEEVLGSKKSYYIKSAFIATGSATKNFLKKQQEMEEERNYVENGQSIPTATKPIDMLYKNGKILILSSLTNSIDIFNPETNTIEKNIQLGVGGFSNKFNLMKDSNQVLVTNVVEKKYVVFDTVKQAVLQVNPIDLQITTLTVLDKTYFEKPNRPEPKPETEENPEDKTQEITPESL